MRTFRTTIAALVMLAAMAPVFSQDDEIHPGDLAELQARTSPGYQMTDDEAKVLADLTMRLGQGEEFDKNGALRDAAKRGYRTVAALLLMHGADVNAQDGYGCGALHLACESDRVAVVALLIEKGADLRLRDKKGFAPLHFAAVEGCTAAAGLLLDAGADANAKADGGLTPLHVSTLDNQVETARLLLDRGADPNAKCIGGYSPLHLAAIGRHEDMAALLKARGADPQLKADDGRTAADIERQESREDVFEVLDRAMQASTGAPGAEPLSPFLEPLREHQQKLRATCDAILELQSVNAPPAALKPRIEMLVAEGDAFKATLDAFVSSATRRGLLEEFEIIDAILSMLDDVLPEARGLAKQAAKEPAKKHEQRIRKESMSFGEEALRAVVAMRLEGTGLEYLIDPSHIEQLRTQIVASIDKIRNIPQTYLQQLKQEFFINPYRDYHTAIRILRRGINHEVEKIIIPQLAIEIAGGGLFIRLGGSRIVEWVLNDLWTKVKEAFRQKGRHEERLERTLLGFVDHRERLNNLPAGAKLTDVFAAIGDARGAICATVFLRHDLTRDSRTELLADLDAGIGKLQAVTARAETRFMVSGQKLAAIRNVRYQSSDLSEALADYRAILANWQEEAAAGDEPVPAGQLVISGNLDPEIAQAKIDKWDGMGWDLSFECDPITIVINKADGTAKITRTVTFRSTMRQRSDGLTYVREKVFTLEDDATVKAYNWKAVSGKAKGVERYYRNGELQRERRARDWGGWEEWNWSAQRQDDGSWILELPNGETAVYGDIPHRLR